MRLRQKASNRRLNPGSTHNGFSADLLATLKAYPHRGIFLDDDLFDIGANTRPAAAINDGLQEMVGNLFGAANRVIATMDEVFDNERLHRKEERFGGEP